LFATHYHELTQLEAEINGVKNFSVSVKEINDTIIFLRKIVPGGADQSYGIEVAKLAGLPTEVIERAKDILEGLEKNQTSKSKIETKEKPKAKSKNNVDTSMQMDFGSLAKDGMLSKLANLDILNMTPMDAMNNLHNIIKEAKELLK
jgi:DNA mismatch repair protein MutS